MLPTATRRRYPRLLSGGGKQVFALGNRGSQAENLYLAIFTPDTALPRLRMLMEMLLRSCQRARLMIASFSLRKLRE
jgi:hypothetical protein